VFEQRPTAAPATVPRNRTRYLHSALSDLVVVPERKYTKMAKDRAKLNRAHFTPQAEMAWRRSASTSRSTVLSALSRSFARYGNTARRSPTDRITTWRVQTWATRYGFAHTCPEFSAASDPLIAIRVAWLPKRFDPFGIYRPQAIFFDGRLDGKIGTPRHEVSCFQMLTSAGND
jgi:hypothetical protein